MEKHPRIRLSNQPEVQDYMRIHKNKHIMTTRFNTQTINENREFREKINKQCVYATSEPVSQAISPGDIMMVLEMNNDTNTIVGIGLLKNKGYFNQHHIYSDPKYNQFSYLGNNHIDRTCMTTEEEQIMKVFDNLCFKGSGHLKRLRGIKSFPSHKLHNIYKMLNIDLVAFISRMFKSRIQQKSNVKSA